MSCQKKNINIKVSSNMIIVDQIIRYLSKDIMLPSRCYATKRDLICIKSRCDCKIFCKKPPPGSVPAFQRVEILKNNPK